MYVEVDKMISAVLDTGSVTKDLPVGKVTDLGVCSWPAMCLFFQIRSAVGVYAE